MVVLGLFYVFLVLWVFFLVFVFCMIVTLGLWFFFILSVYEIRKARRIQVNMRMVERSGVVWVFCCLLFVVCVVLVVFLVCGVVFRW